MKYPSFHNPYGAPLRHNSVAKVAGARPAGYIGWYAPRPTYPAAPRGGTSRGRMALRRWYSTARATRTLVVPPVAGEGILWMGGTAAWPEWISIELLTDEVKTRTGLRGDKNFKSFVGGFIAAVMPGIKKRQFEYEERTDRGRLKFRRCYTQYKVGDFRDDPLTTLPHVW